MGKERLEVPLDSLNKRFDPDTLGFDTTDEVEPLEGLLGQERAESALELALGIDAPGFNLLISGPPGTGRHTAVRRHVERLALDKPIPPDWGYVHNFDDPAQPIPISLPCGWVRILAADMNELIETVCRDVPRAFESDEYRGAHGRSHAGHPGPTPADDVRNGTGGEAGRICAPVYPGRAHPPAGD